MTYFTIKSLATSVTGCKFNLQQKQLDLWEIQSAVFRIHVPWLSDDSLIQIIN